MNGKNSLSVIKRIEIAEYAIKKGVESASIQFDIERKFIDKWTNQIEQLKKIREKELEKKKLATKTRNKILQEKNIFQKISKNLDRSLKKRGYEASEIIKPINLWGIAKKQKCKCAISGIKLTKNNISVDHIIPLSKGGKNTLANIQFVENHVNIMKNNKSLKELLVYCKEIVKNNSIDL